VPAALHGLLRDLVLAARDLAGPSWLAAASDDPDIAAFTALQATPAPPSPAELDEIISRVLWARFPPPGTPRDGGPPPAGTPRTVRQAAATRPPLRGTGPADDFHCRAPRTPAPRQQPGVPAAERR
jgi:hypothetical protein